MTLGREGDCAIEGAAIFVTARVRLRRMSRVNFMITCCRMVLV